MRHIARIGLFCLMVLSAKTGATSISVDADTSKSGIQQTRILRDTGMILAVEFNLATQTNLFSYEFAVQYDTTKFRYLGGDKDYGFSGRQNILTVGGGTVQGLCQKRQNPPRTDIIDLAYTITGTNSAQQVTGTGLSGVLYLKNKMGYEDSSAVTVISGGMASLNGPLQAIDTLGKARIFMSALCSLMIQNTTGGSPGNSDTVVCRVGDTIRVRATALPGYRFRRWSCIAGSVAMSDSTRDSTEIVVKSVRPVLQPLFDLPTATIGSACVKSKGSRSVPLLATERFTLKGERIFLRAEGSALKDHSAKVSVTRSAGKNGVIVPRSIRNE